MPTSTSKRPSTETLLDLFDDLIESNSRHSGRRADPANKYTTDDAVAASLPSLIDRVATEVGTTRGTASRYVKTALDDQDVPLVRIQVHLATDVVQRVDGTWTPEWAKRHGITLSQGGRMEPVITASGFAYAPEGSAGRRNTGYSRADAFTEMVVRPDRLIEYLREVEAILNVERTAAKALADERRADFDRQFPGMRDAVCAFVSGGEDEIVAIREYGNHVNRSFDDDGHRLTIMLGPTGIARLAALLGLEPARVDESEGAGLSA